MDTEKWNDENRRETTRSRRFLILALCAALAVAVVLLYFGYTGQLSEFLGIAPTPSPSPTPSLITSDTPGLHAYFLDVGQGDCALLVSPKGKTMLIDAGGSNAFPTIRDTLDRLGIDRIDVAVLTHLHEDHIGGMAEVITHYPVGELILSPFDIPSGTYAHILDAAAENNVPLSSAYAGLYAMIDWDELCEVRILAPYETNYYDVNDTSLILRVKFGQNALLFTGDAGEAAELVALKALPNKLFHADVLKVGHHGSDTSTGKKFLSTVKPSVAVISVGRDNPYGLPDEAVLSRLEALGTRILRTDTDGTVLITLDGSSVTVVE